MTPAEFVAAYRPYADRAATALGWGPGGSAAILAQWALETGWGTAGVSYNNLAGIKYVRQVGALPGWTGTDGGTFAKWASLDDFTAAYIRNLQWNAAGYPAVVAAGRADYPSPQLRAEAVVRALAASGWDAAHYGGTGANVLSRLTSLWPFAASGSTAGGGFTVAPTAGGGFSVAGPGLSAGLVLAGVLAVVALGGLFRSKDAT
jgi:hypothetical protein